MNAIIRNKPYQFHYFDDGDESVTVQTHQLPDRRYIAVEYDNPDVAGFGFTTIGAIADLFEKLPRAKSEREDRDALAAKWDRARDYRKHQVAE